MVSIALKFLNFASMKKREIIVTNDDGFSAKGITVISQFLRRFGNVTVMAPREAQSGKSASLTLDRTLEVAEIGKEEATGELGSIRIYSLNGTPVDCTKLAINYLFHEGIMPDLLVSGINHGSNASSAAIYSGTLGAAAEATVYDIPAIGLSMNNHRSRPDNDPEFEGLLHYAEIILGKVFETGLPKGTYINVNFPDLAKDDIKGIRMARQGTGRWIKEFDQRQSPRGNYYFWMVGEFQDLEDDAHKDADHRLVGEGYVAVTPVKIDTTDYEAKEKLAKQWNFR